MGCGASVSFALNPEAARTVDANACERSVNIGGGVYRKKGFEVALVTLPFPEEPEVDSAWAIVERSARVHADVNCMGARSFQREGSAAVWGEYEWVTYAQFKVLSEAFGKGLLERLPALHAGVHIGVFGPSTLELLIAQYGCYSQALVTTPMYDTWSGEILEHVLVHADLVTLIVAQSKIDIIRDALSRKSGSHQVTGTVVLPDVEHEEQAIEVKDITVLRYLEVQEAGSMTASGPHALVNPPSASALAVIMYTSGSSGLPKGVELPHSGFVAAAAGIKQAAGVGMQPGVVVACFLPLGHIYPTVTILASMMGGCATGLYHGDPNALLDDFQAMRPEVLPGVPRVYQTIFAAAVEEFHVRSYLTQRVIKNAIDKQTDLSRKGLPRDEGLDRNVFSKLQQKVGGRLRYATTGASPMLPSLQEWVKVCFNVQMSEGYGLTEAYGIALVQEPEWNSIGNVGAPLVCTEVRLHDVPDFGYVSTGDPPQGELCIRGGNLMRGYYKDPGKTAEEIDKDGWLHTGDVARRNPDGTFSIIDRISNVFKLGRAVEGVQGAVLIAPEMIENQLAACGLVNQAWVFGSFNYPHLVAVIVPDANKLLGKAGGQAKFKVSPGWKEEFVKLCATPEANAWVVKDIQSLVTEGKLKAWELPVRIWLESAVDDMGLGFTIQNGLMTPTFKVRRGICKKHYAEALESMYGMDKVEWKK